MLELLTLFALSANLKPLPFSLYLRHGFRSESEDVEANRFKAVAWQSSIINFIKRQKKYKLSEAPIIKCLGVLYFNLFYTKVVMGVGVGHNSYKRNSLAPLPSSNYDILLYDNLVKFYPSPFIKL